MSRVETTVHFRYLIQKTVLILFFVIFLFYNIGLVPVLVCNFYFVVSFCYFGLLYIKDFRKNKHIYRIILIVVLCGCMSGLYTRFFNLSIYFKTVTYMLIAYHYCKTGVGRFYSMVFFGIVETLLIYILLFSNIDPNYFFVSTSRNYVSVISLIATIILYIELYRTSRKIVIFPAIINAIVCIRGIGRGGILTAFFMLFGLVFIKYIMFTNGIIKKTLFISVAVIAMLFACLTPNIIMHVSNAFSRFQSMGFSNDGRNAIWTAYAHAVLSNPLDFFFGGRIADNLIISKFEYNLHNTFLQIHFTYGITFLLVIIIGITRCIKKLSKQKNYLFVILLLSFCLRAMLDQLGYAYFTEVFIYIFMFWKQPCIVKTKDYIANT
ncbi:MAG: hypothetical protein KHZ10_12685 [Clostridium sp.]|nr:hypothetical protein [Clostridium sp.]